uniref:Uncharacterized protein n=1 Tax=Brassica campestris TaxID=3711 RepID=A0A3P6CMQ3_BRACM|nr:unnamed protein product [Brassica rapa]
MTNSNPEKKEKKSKTSEEPTHRKPQQETISTIFQRISKIHRSCLRRRFWSCHRCPNTVGGVERLFLRTWCLSSKPE